MIRVATKERNYGGDFDLGHTLYQRDDQEIILFESADSQTKLGQKSMLYLDLALRIEARDGEVRLEALIEEARPLLDLLAKHFHTHVISKNGTSLLLKFSPIYHELDLLAKMKTISALDVLRVLKSQLVALDACFNKTIMVTGAFSYDFLDHFENLAMAKKDVLGLPDYIFYLPLTLIIVDHQDRHVRLYAHSLASDRHHERDRRYDQASLLIEENLARKATSVEVIDSSAPLIFDVDIADADFIKLVEACKEHIFAGDVYQIVPSRTFFHPIKNPRACYTTLKSLNPSPYMFYLRTYAWSLFGASPETFIKIDEHGRRVAIRPIAGTRRRGFTYDGAIDHELDAREQASLCLDEKELAEHMMLVDLARNDIASVCRPKSRRIKRLLGVDRYSHVMHLVSEVEGYLLDDKDALSAYQASMNMGTLMGAPKVKAAELLRGYEASKRGFYGGAVGYFDLAGDMDTAIIIRSAVVKNDVAYVRAGCGVVFDSSPQFETQETINKAEAVLRAINRSGGA